MNEHENGSIKITHWDIEETILDHRLSVIEKDIQTLSKAFINMADTINTLIEKLERLK